MADRDAAKSFRDRVVANGGRLDVGMRDIRDAFQRTLLDATARREIAAALREAGLQVEPPLDRAGRHDRLLLSTLDRPGVPLSADRRHEAGTESSVDESDGDAALGVATLTGAVATIVGFIVFGFVGGLVLLTVGLLLVLLVAGTDWSARRSFVVSALCLLLLSLLVIAPLTPGEVRTPPKAASKAQPDRRIALRASAEREMNAQNYDRALRIAEVDLRDRGLARRFRRRAAQELLDKADAILFDAPRRALELARRSARFEASTQATELETRAQQQIAAEQETAEPAPPVEETPSVPEGPLETETPDIDGEGSGGGSCLPQSSCPGKRDGDGDGCYCE